MDGIAGVLVKNTTKMFSEDADFSHLEPIDAKYGLCGIATTIFVFQVINKVVAYIGPPKSVTEQDVWKWRNLFISWIHAGICSVWLLSSFWLYPEMLDDLITHHCPYTYALVSFSTGYFIYDFIDMIINKKVFKMWEVSIHHIAVGDIFFYNVIICRCIGFNCVALLAEVNSFFLHSRKLLQMMNFGFDHWFYRINAVLNIFSFIVGRGLSLGTITYGMFFWYHRVAKFYYFVLATSMFVMNLMNPVLLWRLIKNDFLRRDYKKKPIHVNGKVYVNNNTKID